jgi:hypothetical protein
VGKKNLNRLILECAALASDDQEQTNRPTITTTVDLLTLSNKITGDD